jgi:hypothetical protein
MKKFLLMITALFFSSLSVLSQAISLEEAIKRNIITYSIEGLSGDDIPQGSSSHYGKCLTTTIRNHSASAVAIKIESGRFLQPQDTNVQRMLITKTSIIRIEPKKSTTQKLYAMCSQSSKASPSKNNRFKNGKLADAPLLKLAKIIEKNNYHNSTGQDAVWAIANGKDMGYKKAKNQAEREIFGHVQNTFKSKNVDTYNGMTLKIGFEIQLQKTSEISIKIFDEFGKCLKTLRPSASYTQGNHDFEFWIRETDFIPGKYKAVLFVDGRSVNKQDFEL